MPILNMTSISKFNSEESSVVVGDVVEDYSNLNTSDYVEEQEFEDSQAGMERILVPVIFSIVILFGFIGNIIVIIVVIKNKDHFRNTTNLFILNLSIADLLFLLFCVPFHAVIYTTTTGNWPFGGFMCKFVHLVQFSSMVASILTLVAMSADRYMAVTYALETKHLRTPKVAFVMSCIIWLIALAVATPTPMAYSERYYPQLKNFYCSDYWGEGHLKEVYFLMLFVLGYLTPLITIFILSMLIIRQLWLMKQPEGPRMKESINKKRKVTRLIIVVVLVFCLCWLPAHISWLWAVFFINKTVKSISYQFLYFKIMAHVLSYSNSAVNPVIYAFLSANFRRGFQRAVLGRNVHPPPVQRFTFTKSSSVQQANNHGNGYHHNNNRYCSKAVEAQHSSSYSDTCV